MRVRIKFCGGCNPRYDRGEIARRLRETFPEHCFFVTPDEKADAAVVLCGCSSVCADVPDCCPDDRVYVMWEASAWEELCRFLADAGGIAET